MNKEEIVDQPELVKYLRRFADTIERCQPYQDVEVKIQVGGAIWQYRLKGTSETVKPASVVAPEWFPDISGI